MKIPIAAVLLATILPICAHASSTLPIPFIIHYAHPAPTSQTGVAHFTGVDNFMQIYSTRTRLMQQAARECRRGVAQVTLVMQQVDSDQLSLAPSISSHLGRARMT